MSVVWELSRDEAEALVDLIETIVFNDIEQPKKIEDLDEIYNSWLFEGMAENLRKTLGMPERREE